MTLLLRSTLHRARRSVLVGLLCAVAPTLALAQQVPPEGLAVDSPFTIHATVNVQAAELYFNVAPSLFVGINGSRTNALEQGGAQQGDCAFQPGVTYRNVAIRLEIVDQRVRLTCTIDAAVGEPLSPSGGQP